MRNEVGGLSRQQTNGFLGLMRWSAVLLEYEVTSWDSTDLREQMSAEKNVVIIRPVYLCSWLDKDQFCAAQTKHGNRYHHWAREIGSSLQETFRKDLLLARSRWDINAIVLHIHRRSNGENLLIRKPYKENRIWSGYFLSSCLARVKRANLFAMLCSRAFFFRKQTNFKSCLTRDVRT